MNITEKDIRTVSVYLKQHFGDKLPEPQDVVALAQDSSSPIHRYFEWDDKKAAKEYRLIQAKDLIKVVVIDEVADKQPTYNYLRLMSESTESYFRNEGQKVESIYEQLIPSALKDLRTFKDRYKMLSGFEPVIEAIELIEEKYEHEREKETA